MRIGHDVAQHAEARHARLRLHVVLELELERVIGVDAPVRRERHVLAVPLGVAEVRVEAVRRHVQPRAEGPVRAEALAQVDGGADRAVLRPAQLRVAQVGVGALDDEVDESAGRAGSGLRAAQSLQDFDAGDAVDRQHGLRVDGQAVAAEVVAVVDLEAAHGERRPIAGRVVRIGDARVEARQVGQRRGADVEQRFRIDHVGLDRRARQRLREAGDPGGLGGAVAGDLHGLHRGSVLRVRGARERENRRGERRQEVGTGNVNGSHRALSKRWQGNGVGSRGREWSQQCDRFPARGLPRVDDMAIDLAANAGARATNQVQRDFLSQPLGQHP